tara:strand:+ start:1259 stop:1966 length:708 start_codon:yes stop_codon:yes gene_type:complete
MLKKAMILAAGFGKRILPLTKDKPKPLLKIGKETLLSNTLNFLQDFGVNKVVINVHYLGGHIIDYINKRKFNLSIEIVNENEKILDTGGGILNAIKYFSEESFLAINPDTIWSSNYLKELKSMEKIFLKNKNNKCFLLVVNKNKSFDKSFKGDFNLKENLLNREDMNNLNYLYTGLQIINPKIFFDVDMKVFSINKIWDKLIANKELYGKESSEEFFHVSTLKIYKDLIKKKFKY